MTARTLSLLLSIWLFASSFALGRSDASFTTAWVAGALSAFVAVAALRYPGARRGGVAAGVWLAASALWQGGAHPAVRAHDLVVGLLLVGLSFLPGTAPRPAGARTPARPF